MACPQIPELSREEFGRQTLRRWSEKRVPLAGSMELDLRCNLKCHHCYRDGAWPADILGTEEVHRVLDQLAGAGTLWLLFTGGEIFLRRDFFDIYQYAVGLGLKVTLFTNGTMLSTKTADRLASLPPYNIEISLYGYTRETYEKVTDVPGCYERCYRGVELLLDRGLPLKLKTVVMKTNKHEFMDMYHFAESRGITFKWDTLINPHLDGSLNPLSVRLSPREAVEMDFALPFRFEEYRNLFEPQKNVTSEGIFDCGAGSRTFHIDPYGNMKMCLLMRQPEFSLRRMSFRRVWEEEFPRFYNGLRRPGHPCSSCNLISLCDKCPAWSLLEKGDLEARVEHACEVGHLRAKKLGYDQGPVDPIAGTSANENDDVVLPVVP